MNDEVIAALERAIDAMEWEVANANGDDEQVEVDAALIRALIDTLRQGSERRYGDVAMAMAYDCGHAAGMAEATAKAVAWLRRMDNDFPAALGKSGQFANAIEDGAHLK